MVQLALHHIHNLYFTTLVMSTQFWTWDLLCKMEGEKGGKKEKHCGSLHLLQPHFLAQKLIFDAQPSQTNGT